MSKEDVNKRIFIKLMSTASCLTLNDKDRLDMMVGVIPNGYDIHYVLPIEQGGRAEILNMALIKKTDKEELDKRLEHILLAQDYFSKEDFQYLLIWTKSLGGSTLRDILNIN